MVGFQNFLHSLLIQDFEAFLILRFEVQPWKRQFSQTLFRFKNSVPESLTLKLFKVSVFRHLQTVFWLISNAPRSPMRRLFCRWNSSRYLQLSLVTQQAHDCLLSSCLTGTRSQNSRRNPSPQVSQSQSEQKYSANWCFAAFALGINKIELKSYYYLKS